MDGTKGTKAVLLCGGEDGKGGGVGGGSGGAMMVRLFIMLSMPGTSLMPKPVASTVNFTCSSSDSSI